MYSKVKYFFKVSLSAFILSQSYFNAFNYKFIIIYLKAKVILLADKIKNEF